MREIRIFLEVVMQARRGALAILGIHCCLLIANPAVSPADSLDAASAAPSEAEALQAEMQPLWESLQRATQERDAALAQVDEATGERRLIYDEHLWERQLDVGRALKALSANLAEQR